MADNIIHDMAQIQTILIQMTNPNSHFNRWSRASAHKDRVAEFSKQLGLLMQQIKKRPGPNNPPALTEFMAAIHRLNTDSKALYNLFHEERYANLRAFFEQNRDFLKTLNQAFSASTQTAVSSQRPLPKPPVSSTSNRPLPTPPVSNVSKRSAPPQTSSSNPVRPPVPKRPPMRARFNKVESEPKKPSFKKTPAKRENAHAVYVEDIFNQIHGHVIEDLSGNKSTIVGDSAPIIVDPANAKTMNGNGGMSGAIKSFYETLGRKREYVHDLLQFPKIKGNRCPNGEVKHTNTAGLDVLHTSAPDLRSKANVSREGPTEKAQQALFDAYYNCYVAASDINRRTGLAKELNCPLLGAGIFKWPMELSAEIAGKALQKFRETHGNDLQVNFYVHPSALQPDQSKNDLTALLNAHVATGMRAQLFSTEVISALVEKFNTMKKDNYEIYKPLSAQLKALLEQNLSPALTASAASRLVQATIDKIKNDRVFYPQNMVGVIEGNIANTYDMIAQKGTTKHAKLSFNEQTKVNQSQSTPLAKTDFHGKKEKELKSRSTYAQAQSLPDVQDLLASPLRTVYVCLQAPLTASDPTINNLQKLSNQGAGFTPLEAVSQQEPNHIATTSEPNEVIEWAEQLQTDLKGKATNIIELQIPESLLEDNRLDNRVLNHLRSNDATKDLLKIKQAVPLNVFKESHKTKNVVPGQPQAESTGQPQAKSTGQPQAKSTGQPQAEPIGQPSTSQFTPREMSIMKFLDKAVQNMRDLYDPSLFYQDQNNTAAKQYLINDVFRYQGHPNTSISAKAHQIWDSIVDLARDLTIPKNEQNEALRHTDVRAMYSQEREISVNRSNKLPAFAKSTIKSLGDSTTRDQQISALQELVDNFNNSQPNNREQAMLNLYSALQYVKHSISMERKLVSSSLEKVCNKILETMPKPERELTSSQNMHNIGQAAIEATNSFQKSSRSKNKPQ